jgi:hypothetical protein
MIWPSPEQATLLIFGGTLNLPQRPLQAIDATLPPFTEPEAAPPEKPTAIRRDGLRTERIDRIALELSAEGKSQFHVEEDDPLSAMAELRRTQTMSRMANSGRDADPAIIHGQHLHAAGEFARLEGANEVRPPEWDRSIPRDFT